MKRAIATLLGPLPVGNQPSWAAKAAAFGAQLQDPPGGAEIQVTPPPKMEAELTAAMEAARRQPAAAAAMFPPRGGEAARPMPAPPGPPPSVSPPSDAWNAPAQDPWNHAIWTGTERAEEPWWVVQQRLSSASM